MKVIILAAGESKRLRPLTENKHKSLLRVGGRTILDRQLDALRPYKPEKIVIVIGFEGDKIREHVAKEHADLPMVFIENKDFQSTGAAHSLWLAQDYLVGTCLYLNGDVVCDPRIIKEIIEHKKDTVTAIHKNPWNEEQVNIIHDEDGKILEIGKHIGPEKSHGEFLGITKIGKNFIGKLRNALSHITQNKNKKSFAVDAFNHAIKEGGKKYIVDVTHLPAIEIDTPEDLKIAEQLFDKN